jgi:cell division control protein 6
MGVFDDMLKGDESLFKNPIALDFDYQPKLVPHREREQKHIASCMKPLFQNRNGRNIFVFGAPGIGKTVATKHILRELEEKTDEIIPIYVNCWQKNTTYKIVLAICDAINYKFTQNKKTDELFEIIKKVLNKRCAVFVFDEIDKMDDFTFLYSILEEIYKKSIILVTNEKEWLSSLDKRIKSRLATQSLEFKPYNLSETKNILKQRLDHAFVKDVFDKESLEMVANKTFELSDIRIGLHILKESANIAEDQALRSVNLEHVKKAISELSDFTLKKEESLDDDAKLVLDIVKKNSGKKIGDIYRAYKEAGGEAVYKTFQRRIKKLEQSRFVTLSKIIGGAAGKTTIVKITDTTKKLTEF